VLTHFYFLTSLKRRLFCFMITSVPFSLFFSVIKWCQSISYREVY
jgi:hypothetical protein